MGGTEAHRYRIAVPFVTQKILPEAVRIAVIKYELFA